MKRSAVCERGEDNVSQEASAAQYLDVDRADRARRGCRASPKSTGECMRGQLYRP